MAFDYAAIRDVVAPVIADLGTAVTLHSTVQTYTPGQPASETTTTVVGRGVLTDMAIEDRPQSLIEKSIQRILLSPAGITTEPQPGDRVEIAGQTYTVLTVSLIRPATVTLCYDLLVQR